MNSYSWYIFVLVHIVCIAVDSESDTQFGISSRKIAGHFDFPFHASIQRKFGFDHLCSGAILNNRFILTTASCVHSEIPEWIHAILGKTGRYDEGDHVDIDLIIRHAMFTSSMYINMNDIALLRTNREIQFSYQIVSIQLPSYSAIHLNVSGWNTKDDTLQYHNATLVPCKLGFDSNVCAKSNGFDLDAASLLSVQSSYGGMFLVGILSNKGNGDDPDVYTRIETYKSWIEKKFKFEEVSGGPVKVMLILILSIVVTVLIIVLLVKCKKRRIQRRVEQAANSMQTVSSISRDYTMPVANQRPINSGGPMHYVPTAPPSVLYPTVTTPVSPPPPSYEHLFPTKNFT